MEIVIKELDGAIMESASSAVIDALSPFPKQVKIATLHMLMESFPEPYEIVERTKQ